MCFSVASALRSAKLERESIVGIAFDSTCSLVIVDEEGRPVSVSLGGETEQNVIMWMDHRAIDIAQEINRGGHSVLRNVGGNISPEMGVPKILWLKRSLPSSFHSAAHFFDLPDYLTYRATGSLSRSLCSTVCKLTYQGAEGHWDADFFCRIGLQELPEAGFSRLGIDIRSPGEPIPGGLSLKAAEELGLIQGLPVSVSVIDAHAGCLGLLPSRFKSPPNRFDNRLAVISGTSECHMALNSNPLFVPGVWGPYYGAVLPGTYLSEGGQSAVGLLLDFIVHSHPAWPELESEAVSIDVHPFTVLNNQLLQLDSFDFLTQHFHVCPSFHGNRSPLADPDLRGIISGLNLRADRDNLLVFYLATMQGLACGTRHIIETLNQHGHALDSIVACGGLSRNTVYMQILSDVTGMTVLIPKQQEAVLLGTAMLAATASNHFQDLDEAMLAMASDSISFEPDLSVSEFYALKYRVHRKMYLDQIAYREIMSSREAIDAK